MIPILYGKSETAFTSNGLGRLTDCMSCLVTEERNGIFECEFQYPVTGKLYNEMVTNGGIVSVTHDDAKDRQPFDIYKYSAPINGIVTFNARHISYRLSGIVVKPYTAASCALALNGIVTNSVSTNPFTFWTDKAVTTTFKLETPTSAKALLVGQQGSILDVYGKGEYKFDKFDVKLYTNRGTNSGVTIRYGKNLSDTLVENDSGEYYNAIVPYWKGQDGTLVTLTGWYVVQTGETLKYCVPVDFSSEFQSQPTELELQTRAAAYLANNTPWLPKENVKVDFVQLWNTDEYKDVAVLERVKLCDTVAIYYPALGLTNSSAKVIKVVYDTLLERYSSIELGEPQQTLAQAIIQPYAQAIASISDKASVSFMEEAIQAATDLIAGGLGGHVVINRNADGEPEEILIMDTDDTSTAVNVWRWNLNGLAHSHSGYNGPFDDIAITQDGKINASMITAGTLSANRISGGTIDASDVTITNLNASNITSGTISADKISGGTLTVGGVNNINGIIRILDANGNVAGYIANSQFYTSWINGSILEEASLTAGTLLLRTDGTQSVVVTRDTQGGGAIELYDAAGNRRITLGMLNGSTFEDTTINGVLDVTQRRCSRSRIGGGWHRVLTFAAPSAAYARGATGHEIVFHITRRRTTAGEETHEIKMLCQYDNVSFVDEVSKSLSGDQLITQIRYAYDSTHGYVDIYVTDAADYVTVDYEVYCEPSYQELYTSSNLEYVWSDEAGTVMTTYTFVANGAATGDLTVNGVLDVTRRRCEATLSSAGWYRAIVYNAYDSSSAQGASGEIVTIKIVYTSQVSVQHEISLWMSYGKVAFLNETSHGTTNLVDKIRYTYAGAVGYVDIHVTSSSSVTYNVSFDVASRTYAQERWLAENMTYMGAADPANETVLAVYTFSANTDGDTSLTAMGKTWYFRKRNGVVYIDAPDSMTPTTSGSNSIGTLPSEFRPSYVTRLVAANAEGAYKVLLINTDGSVSAFCYTTVGQSTPYSITGSYLAI